MKGQHKTAVFMLFLSAILSSGYSQLLIKNSANSEILRAMQTGQVGIGTTLLNSDKLTVGGSEQVSGALTVSGATSLNTVQIAGGGPGSEKILTCVDNQGNALWSSRPTLASVRVYYGNRNIAGQPIVDPVGDPTGKGYAQIKVNFDSLEWDANSDFNLSTDYFTVPRAGYYIITSNISIFYANGTEPNPVASIFLAYLSNGSSTEVRLAQGSTQQPRDLNNQLSAGTVTKLQAGDRVYVVATKNGDDEFKIYNTNPPFQNAKIYLSIREL
jgi:hypothetical protein